MATDDPLDRGDAYRVVPLEVADDIVRQLAESIGLQDPEKTAHLKEWLAQIGGRYRRWRRQEDVTPDRRERLAHLRRLQASASKLADDLATLDKDTKFDIGLCLRKRDGDSTDLSSWRWQVVDQLAADLRLFEKAAQRATAGISKRGPRQDTSLYFLVQMLGDLYRELTGEQITHNPNVKTKYTGEPKSAAGCFILAAAKTVDSSIRSTSVNTAVGVLVKAMASQKPSIK